ncbi:MAG: cell division protein, partial [Devosia sp.]
GRTYPSIAKLASSSKFTQCVEACVGLDGRSIRKMVANALAASPATAMDPGKVTIDDLLAAAGAAQAIRGQKETRK